MIPFIIAGLTTGSIYGLAGIGLVLTYKTSGIFNFAHGSLATVAAFVFYSLSVEHGLPWPLAAAICIVVLGPVLGLALEVLSRRLSATSLTVRVVATVGLLLVIQSVVVMVYGSGQRPFKQYLPTHRIPVGGTSIAVSDIVVVVVGLAAAAALVVFFRVNRVGVAMQAVVDNPELLGLAGTNPRSVRRYAWIIGSSFAALSGVLLAPLVPLDATTMTLLVVQAFGAAAIGRFANLPLTYLGGIVVGIATSLATKYFTTGLFSGLPAAFPFVILFILLLVSRRGRLPESATVRVSQRPPWRAPWPIQTIIGIAVLIIFGAAPTFAGTHLVDWISALSYIIIILSLGLLVRSSGQVSLAQVSFMAIGACALHGFASDAGLPWGVALILAGLVAVPVGALLSIPAIRMSGLYLALATLGFGLVVSVMFYTSSLMFTNDPVGLIEPRPSGSWARFGSDRGYYYLVLGITVVICVAVTVMGRGRLGRLLRALRDSPRGLVACGSSVNVTRVLVFCLSSFLAAIGGALQAGAQGVVNGDSYPPLLSLTLFVLTIIAIGGEPWYAVLGAAGLALIPSYLPGTNTTTALTLVFGVSALIYALTPESARGVPPIVATFVDRLRRRRNSSAAATEGRGVKSLLVDRRAERPITLDVSGLTVRFGGVVAVNDLQLRVSPGTVVGLIGPNGAGKTTTFNAISALNKPSAGQIRLGARDVHRLGAAARARAGLGRTFQIMELFDSLTVRENVELGVEGRAAGVNAFGHLLRAPGARKTIIRSAADVMEACELSALAERVVGTLSTGQRRLVELARCLAGSFTVLLLDEPSSGLDHTETAAFGDILRRTVTDRGVGILLVEHDMSLVSTICDYIYVLDFGEKIFEGKPDDVMNSPIVRAAYLGFADAADNGNGPVRVDLAGRER